MSEVRALCETSRGSKKKKLQASTVDVDGYTPHKKSRNDDSKVSVEDRRKKLF